MFCRTVIYLQREKIVTHSLPLKKQAHSLALKEIYKEKDKMLQTIYNLLDNISILCPAVSYCLYKINIIITKRKYSTT